MDFIGRKFTDLTTGNIVEVKDHFEDIAILSNNAKIKVGRLMDKNYFDEYIDPRNFFQNESLLNTFAQKIRQIPDEVISSIKDDGPVERVPIDTPMSSNEIRPIFNEPAVLMSDPELEKEELMRKYGIPNNPISDAQKQLEKFQNLLSDFNDEEQIQRIEVNRNEDIQEFQEVREIQHQVIQEPVRQIVQIVEEQKKEDPIISMFKNVKRNREFNISIDIQNKIPRPDFIEMMEDSYNTSIIEFLADEFTNNILNNPSIIKNKIIDEIRRIVYKEERTEEKDEIVIKQEPSPQEQKEVKPKTTRKKSNV